jgi:hypothetical protein
MLPKPEQDSFDVGSLLSQNVHCTGMAWPSSCCTPYVGKQQIAVVIVPRDFRVSQFDNLEVVPVLVLLLLYV